MRSWSWLFSVTIALFFSCTHSTQPEGITLDSSVDGKTVVFHPNQMFLLELDVLADAGFQWDWQLSDSTVVTSYSNPSYRPKNGGPVVPGGPTVETFYFQTKTTGECVVNLVEHQRWMTDTPPRDSIVFKVRVEP